MQIAFTSSRVRFFTIGMVAVAGGLVAITCPRVAAPPPAEPREGPQEEPVVREELVGDWRELFGDASLFFADNLAAVHRSECGYLLEPWGATREWVVGRHAPGAPSPPIEVRWHYRFDDEVLVLELDPGVERRFVRRLHHYVCLRDYIVRRACDR